MKRQGFTMIELVFIIVILGILGAIAVPKMAASRLDAKAVALKTDIGTIIQAFPAMALSQGNATTITFSDVINLRDQTDDTSAPWRFNNHHPAGQGRYIFTSFGKGGAQVKDDGRTLSATSSCVTLAIFNTSGTSVEGSAETGHDRRTFPTTPYLRVWFNDSDPVCAKIGQGTQRIPLAGASVLF